MKKYIRQFFKMAMELVVLVVLFIAILAIKSADYLLNEWGEINFSTVLYQLSSPLRGTNEDTINQYLQQALYSSIAIFVVLFIVWIVFAKLSKRLQLNIVLRVGKHDFNAILKCVIDSNKRRKIEIVTYASVFLCIGCLLYQRAKAVDLFTYIKDVTNYSTIFEERYVSPASVSIDFGEDKKNLIYIYMESMETTYSDKETGGQKDINYIPNLIDLAEKNVSFSNNEKMGGLFSAPGTDWTMGALLSSTTGIPYKLPVGHNMAGAYVEFLPGAISLGEILEQNGYKNYFLCGSDAWFGGRSVYFEQHGNYTIYDYNTVLQEGVIPEDYYEFWGIEDQKLYEYAKEKITAIASQEGNFNITLLTVDTHQSEGYICTLCGNDFDEQYANVISCADKQLIAFIEWIQQQNWYEDTVVVVSGDHLSMNNTFFDEIDIEERKIYNCFINTDLEIQHDQKNRQACVLDLFPTTIVALGAKIEGDRLGLGTNLFSDRATIAEELGVEEFNSQIARYSKFYNEEFIKAENIE